MPITSICIAIAEVINASFQSFDEIQDKEALQEYIENITDINSEVLKISINMPDEHDV